MNFRHSIINGGTFIHSGSAYLATTNTPARGFEILHGKIAGDAFHNSGEPFDRPKCHPKTRKAVLDDIMRWIRQDWDQWKDILWLYGPAGAGKSAIAQTISEMCEKLGLLVASFFFSRSSSSRNNEKRLMASIAYQLALQVPQTRQFIESAVQLDPAIFEKSMEIQAETLIILPLCQARSTVTPAIAEKWPRLILIDGLDECNGDLVQRSIIYTLSTALLRHRVPLILFVASRPEPHIRNAFNAVNISDCSHHIVLDNSYNPDADIEEFLSSRFKSIKENHPLATFIPKSWPPAKIIHQLVQKSSGQFIYASTVMKYLDSPKHKPMKRLDVVIGLLPVGGDVPYKELDTLYTHIFSFVENIAGALQIIGFLLFRGDKRGTNCEPTPKFLECLFGLDPGDVYLCLSELHSILDIPLPTANNMPIRISHASLSDFLVDKLRSGNYFLDDVMVHEDIAQRCLPRIKGSDIVVVYSIANFAFHCSRASTDSKGLRDNLMQTNLQEWFRLLHFFRLDAIYIDVTHFFEWLKKADTDGGLLSHVQYFWDQSLLAELNKPPLKGNEVDFAVVLILSQLSPSIWVETIFSTMKHPNELMACFACKPDMESYSPLYIDFFEDRKRSGKYHVDGEVYARIALGFIQDVFKIQGPRMIFNHSSSFTILGTYSPKSHREANFQSALESMATLLSKAAPSTTLCSILQDHEFESGAGDHIAAGLESLVRFKSSVETYLEKCDVEFCPKPTVLRST